MCFVLSSFNISFSFLFFPFFLFKERRDHSCIFLSLGLSFPVGPDLCLVCMCICGSFVSCLVRSLSMCVCVCMRMCQRLYEMCPILSLVSLPGPQSVFLSVLFHTLFNFTTLSPFYHLTPRILCLGSPFFGTEPPFPDMSNMHLYSVG